MHVFHETAISSPKWKGILSQTQIFCIFPSAMDLVINYLVKFVSRSYAKSYVSRQQLWLTKLVRKIGKKSGFLSFCVDRRRHVFGAAKYRSGVENPDQQECYLNSITSDKLFNTFTSRRTDNREVIEFVIEKQIRETGSRKIYELKTNKGGESNDRNDEKEQQRGGGADGLQARKSRIRRQYVQTEPRFILARYKARKNTDLHSGFCSAKGDESSYTSYKKAKRKLKRV